MKNLQFLFPSIKILLNFFMIASSSTEANDTYTCFLFKLTNSLVIKMSFEIFLYFIITFQIFCNFLEHFMFLN